MIVHEGHAYAVNSVAFSPDGKSVISGSNDQTVRIWDAQSPTPISQPLKGHTWDIHSVSYSPLGNLIASGSWDKTIRLWDTNTGQKSGKLLKNDTPLLSVTFSPDGRLIASGSGSYGPTANAVQLWDVQNRTAVSKPFPGRTMSVWSVSFSLDGTRLVCGSSDRTIHVWDVAHGAITLGPVKGHTDKVRSTAFSPDGTHIVSCSYDGTIQLWDIRGGGMTGEPYKGHTNSVYSAIFSPCGTYVASGGADRTVRLWDTRVGRQVDQPFKEHTDTVTSVVFSPCGRHIASGSYDRRVIIRNILGEYPNSDDKVELQIVTNQMSTLQIFDCLRHAGCVDLSSQMDVNQGTALIVSGGGFGDIWKGQMHNGGTVAIKAWRTNSLEQCEYKTIKRAARELFLWSRMDHPHIHRLQGVILFRDQYLGMVSEWMDNGNLHEYLRKHPDADRYELCAHVASGLEYMHSRNTIHGDLKAANVLVSPGGVARLSDFDFSIMSEVSSLVFSESSNSRSGSIRWAAPEVILSERPQRSTQSDVYALGMTMLEIFTGDVPYPECRQDFTILKTIEKGVLPTRPLERIKEDQKGNEMWKLLLDCWNQNFSERPSSGQVVETLSDIVNRMDLDME